MLKFSLSKVSSELFTKLLPSQKFVLYNKEKFGNENFTVKFTSLEGYSVGGDYHPKCLILYMSAQISLYRALAKYFSCLFHALLITPMYLYKFEFIFPIGHYAWLVHTGVQNWTRLHKILEQGY